MSIDWLRWYHGTVSDPKFAAIARKSKQPRVLVLAVWQAILEFASQASDRGSIELIDLDTIAACLDADNEAVVAVFDAMTAKGLIIDGRVAAWNRRQVYREDDSAERVRRFREKQRQAKGNNGLNNPVTHGNAPVTHDNAPVTTQSTDTDTDTDTEITQTEICVDEKRESARATNSALAGGTLFFTLTPERLALAAQQGHPDPAWVAEQTLRFVNHYRASPPSPKGVEGAWLNWLRKGRAYDVAHPATRAQTAEQSRRSGFFAEATA